VVYRRRVSSSASRIETIFIDGSVNCVILTSGSVRHVGLLSAAIFSFVQSKICTLLGQCYLFWSDKGEFCMCKHLLPGCTKCRVEGAVRHSKDTVVDCTLIQSLYVVCIPWAKTSWLVGYCT
jgi:hypothetical protein